MWPLRPTEPTSRFTGFDGLCSLTPLATRKRPKAHVVFWSQYPKSIIVDKKARVAFHRSRMELQLAARICEVRCYPGVSDWSDRGAVNCWRSRLKLASGASRSGDEIGLQPWHVICLQICASAFIRSLHGTCFFMGGPARYFLCFLSDVMCFVSWERGCGLLLMPLFDLAKVPA